MKYVGKIISCVWVGNQFREQGEGVVTGARAFLTLGGLEITPRGVLR